MSLVSSQVNTFERHRSDRQRVRRQMESMWSDAAARKFLDVVDELEQADRDHARALAELDGLFDKALKLLGPI